MILKKMVKDKRLTPRNYFQKSNSMEMEFNSLDIKNCPTKDFIHKALYKLALYEDCMMLDELEERVKSYRLKFIKDNIIQCRMCNEEIKMFGKFFVYCPYCGYKISWKKVDDEKISEDGFILLPGDPGYNDI